jgi:hypothetical protein
MVDYNAWQKGHNSKQSVKRGYNTGYCEPKPCRGQARDGGGGMIARDGGGRIDTAPTLFRCTGGTRRDGRDQKIHNGTSIRWHSTRQAPNGGGVEPACNGTSGI